MSITLKESVLGRVRRDGRLLQKAAPPPPALRKREEIRRIKRGALESWWQPPNCFEGHSHLTKIGLNQPIYISRIRFVICHQKDIAQLVQASINLSFNQIGFG